jgi:uncharacterized membrane protein (UPF0136 family)
MLTRPLSPAETQAAQILVGVALAVFAGLRFVPSRYRQRVGVALTVCYLLGIAGFVVYTLAR